MIKKIVSKIKKMFKDARDERVDDIIYNKNYMINKKDKLKPIQKRNDGLFLKNSCNKRIYNTNLHNHINSRNSMTDYTTKGNRITINKNHNKLSSSARRGVSLVDVVNPKRTRHKRGV